MLPQMLQLGVIGSRYFLHLIEQRLDRVQVIPQDLFPRDQVHVSKPDGDLAAGLLLRRIVELDIFIRLAVLKVG